MDPTHPEKTPKHTTGHGRSGLSAIRLLPLVCFALTVIVAASLTKSSTASAWLVCGYSILPSSNSYTADSTKDTVQVSTSTGCNWQAVSNVGWMNITSPVGGAGSDSGPFQFDIQPNTGAPNTETSSRTGTLTLKGAGPPVTALTFTATQSGCKFSVPSSGQCVPASQGTYNVSVSTGGSTMCPWTASSNTSWILVNTTIGIGDGTASYSVSQNTGVAARAGTFSAGGRTVTVNQLGISSCAFPIAPSSQSFSGAGGSSTIAVTTPPCGCSWTATPAAPWIKIDSGGTGSGNGTVNYTVAANPTSATRSSNIAVAGQTFTVTQAEGGSGCMYSLSPNGAAYTPSGGTGSFAIAAPAGCTWTASSNATWITISDGTGGISGGTSGSGAGQISYMVAANPGPAARQGLVTIPDQNFTVDQAAPGDQADLSVAFTGGTGGITDGSSQPTGTRLTYTISVRNAGPNSAMGVTLSAVVPVGSSFASASGPGSSTPPSIGRSGPITFSVGSIPANGSATFAVVISILGAPGSSLIENASVSSLTADPVPGNNSASLITPILGGGIVELTWDQPPPTAAEPTPAPTNLRAGPATSAPATSLSLENVTTQDQACSVVGYNVYLSTSSPVQTVPANLWKALPPTTTTSAPVAPGGTFMSVTTLWNCGGTIVEAGLTGSGGSNQTGVAAPPVVMSVRVSSKLRATGNGFSDSVEVFVDAVPFSKPSSVRNGNTLLIQKGTLIDGRGISDVLLPGKTVLISFRNSDGGMGALSYTQQ